MNNRHKLLAIIFLIILSALHIFYYIDCGNIFKESRANVSRETSRTEDSDDLIDWNDVAQIEADSLRTGFGEHGAGGVLTDAQEIARNDELFEIFGMSVIVSDKISVNRSSPDFRHPNCKVKKYSRDLPRVSIVIIFHNEVFSAFKRTLHTLYNRTPHELIEEVILVNDMSTLNELYEPLAHYVKEHFPALDFRIINLTTRYGAMKSRIEGVKVARSEFVFVSEPHCEMTYNWLPPLLDPVVKDPKVVTIPIIDSIEYSELRVHENGYGNNGSRGAFDWKLEYQQLKRLPIPADLDPSAPFHNPVMTGGIFLMRREYFFEIGPYDDGAVLWGAEGFEMSLKIWLCGGRLLEVPCSRVSHMFRLFNKFRNSERVRDFVGWNNKRLAEIWFDDYKKYIYMKDPRRYGVYVGDISKELQLKKRLQCKPFQYYLNEIVPDLLQNFPPIVPSYAYGSIRLHNSSYCLDSFYRSNGQSVGLYPCNDDLVYPQESQNFELLLQRDLRFKDNDRCLEGSDSLVMNECNGNENQKFFYDPNTMQLVNMMTSLCIEGDVADSLPVKLRPCDLSNAKQFWEFGVVNKTAIRAND